ncbi:hypothetical protein WICPIJ_008964 [Wickerhamomyces pijperi]|uniref:Cyclin-like domain-containing protein n=1 Tax=Wickerhamomyces pijperi TaxID=599730 RepID=A0A9P8PSW9_WICPI|nr:hypothetical protein WICPIJ_008964 [Wickerhamomyces pijperi]
MVEIPTGPKGKLPQRLTQIKNKESTTSTTSLSTPNSRIRSPITPSVDISTVTNDTAQKTETPTNGNMASSSTEKQEAQITSTIQLSRPFLTRQQIKFARSKTIENPAIYNQRLLQLHQYLLKICHSFKFPMRVLEGSMYYYQRFYLHNKFEKTALINPLDVGITCLFIVSKNEDTIKKLRDLLILFNQTRGVTLSAEQFENYRKRILSIEFQILETIGFDFRTYHSEEFLIKYNKLLKVDKETSYISWLILCDTYQTDVSLKYPPHIIAICCIILNNKLSDSSLKLTTDYQRLRCEEKLVNECLQDILTHYVESFKITGLALKFPDYQIKFVHIKMEFNESKPQMMFHVDEKQKQQQHQDLEKDQFFQERDFTTGERRYMLENQKKRLYAEVDK